LFVYFTPLSLLRQQSIVDIEEEDEEEEKERMLVYRERRRADAIDLFYALLKAAPQVVRIVYSEGEVRQTLLDLAREKSTPIQLLRALHRAAPDLYPTEYRQLNYEARKGVLHILRLPLSALAGNAEFRVWHRLLESGNKDLIIIISSFL
jgi:hypothetical protein